MGSALAMWAYHRRLSMDAQRISAPPDSEPRVSLDKPERVPRTKRTSSECSDGAEHRRMSVQTQESDDEPGDNPNSYKKEHRRFSLDVIFGKKSKKGKPKSKRSGSVSTAQSDQESGNQKEYKYPGIYNSDFALMYFI